MAAHFRKKGLPVPEVYICSKDKNCYLQEDLGDILLFNAIEKGRHKVYFDLSFCSGLQVRVLTYTDSRYSQHLGDIRKLFINVPKRREW